ncbi:MAG: hypothetical protein LBP85_10915 [Prevotellaceae bacterium]|nr:hypothetical protein [Prevotellaceae bacterium]
MTSTSNTGSLETIGILPRIFGEKMCGLGASLRIFGGKINIFAANAHASLTSTTLNNSKIHIN